MAGYLMAGFDVAKLGGFAAALNDGTNSGTASLASGTYAHRDLSSVTGTGTYTDLATGTDTAFDAVLTTLGATVTYSTTTHRYTLTFGAACSVDFTTATLATTTGKALAAALGFDYTHTYASGGSASDPYNISLSTQTTYTGNVAPYYYIALAKDGVAKFSRPYHAGGQTVRQASTNASAYAVRPTTLEQRVKWTMRFQTLASVFADQAAASARWTYEDHLEHAWLAEPVLLHTSTLDLVCKHIAPDLFTEDARDPIWNDYHGYWDLPVEMQYLGSL